MQINIGLARDLCGTWMRTALARVRICIAAARAYLHRLRTHRSLVTRLLLLLLSGTAIIYCIGIVGLWWTSSRLMEDSLQRQALQWIAEMDELGPGLYGGAPKKDAVFIESRIKNFPEISFVRYFDHSGRTVLRQYGGLQKPVPGITAAQRSALAQRQADRPYLFDRSVPVDDSLLGGTYVRVITPVRVSSLRADGLLDLDLRAPEEESKIIGYIDLGINPNLHRDSLARSIAFGGLLTAGIFMVALLIGRRLIKRALAPLTDLQRPLARLARGEIDVSVNAHGDAEIVAIGDALNATIGALKQRDATLRRLAQHDGLTGLINRRHFVELLDAEIVALKETGGSSALLFVDLDRFKYVNDVLGHAGGDKLLVEVAQLIRNRMRTADVVARFGGDEFTVLVREVTRAGALEVARLIREMLRDYYFVSEQQTFNVYCSIGVAMIGPQCSGAEEALLHADTACYDAKLGGRNRFQIYEPRTQGMRGSMREISWSEAIKHALKDNGFRLVYQPIQALGEGQGEFYEVLLRMPDESGVDVSPAAFLPVAERFGLLADLDRWVVTHALAALAQFRARGRDITFSINLSGQSFEDPALVRLIKDQLRAHAIPPRAVVFEITEQTAVRYMDKAKRLMQTLIDAGCRFSLDDFGVGFSSFGYLKHLPVSFVKIDGSFVENMAADAVDQAMVRAIAQIARALGKEVIAEFVQDDATIELLRRFKIDYVQGHHVGMPLPHLPPATPRALARPALAHLGAPRPLKVAHNLPAKSR